MGPYSLWKKEDGARNLGFNCSIRVTCVTLSLPVLYVMAGRSEERWSIDKLEGSNWSTWKFQMKHLLLAKGLWGIAEGTQTLAAGADVQATEEFTKNSQQAFSTIVIWR